MTDYSQTGEQPVILSALRDIETGRFLDIGSYHPTVFSNTRALYELGWSGIMIEPSPGPMRSLLAEYGNEPRITLIQAAVALAPGLVEMRISDDAVSTADEKNYERWKTAGGFIGRMLVPGITLVDIFGGFGGFDFINIDVEGGSAELFLKCLDLKVFPKCFCVEVDEGRLNEMMTKASASGYTAKVLGANLVLWQ
jgi:FkbM family methyltransferase